jgi:hypothetical protein
MRVSVGFEDDGESDSIILVVAGVGLDDVPEPLRLQIYLYDQRPLGVVCAHERGIDDA